MAPWRAMLHSQPADHAVDLEVRSCQSRERADPGGLDDVGGVLVVVQDPSDHGPQARVVPADQGGDGVQVVVVAVELDQLGVGDLLVLGVVSVLVLGEVGHPCGLPVAR